MLGFPLERPIFLREYTTGSYSCLAYFISKVPFTRKGGRGEVCVGVGGGVGSVSRAFLLFIYGLGVSCVVVR